MQFSTVLSSSLGKKIFMGLTGLMLSGFILVHLIGNITLLSPDRDPFNKYAHFLTHGLGNFIYALEFGLAAVFLVHFIYAVWITLGNRSARPVKYAVVTNANGNSKKSIASITMIWTGVLIILFTVAHLFHFKFGEVIMYTTADGQYMRDLYATVYLFFGDIWNVTMYVIVMAALGFHVSHGVWSAFQSLGLSGKKFTPVVYGVSAVFAIAMAIGFIAFPVIVYVKVGGTL
jgi:succinate dehydrogenase / fumarate reductase cytochrome b subunit